MLKPYCNNIIRVGSKYIYSLDKSIGTLLEKWHKGSHLNMNNQNFL